MLGEFLKLGISFLGLFTPPPKSSSRGHPDNTQDRTLLLDRSQIFPTVASFRENGRAGRLGGLISQVIEISDIPPGKMWVGETVMRGPLLVHRERYMSLGGLDTLAFFLGNDDHDLAYRAFVTQGYRTAFVPVGFNSPIHQGSTRKNKSVSTMIFLSRHMRRTSKHLRNSGLYSFLKIGEKSPLSPIVEVRSFSLT
jgi:GT2 family glycosyltransferase